MTWEVMRKGRKRRKSRREKQDARNIDGDLLLIILQGMEIIRK